MSIVIRTLVLVPLLAATVAGSAVGQNPASRRHGFWLNAGLGYGSLGASCDICNSDREGGLAGNFALGATVSNSLLLGVESDGWTKTQSNITLTSWNLSGVAYFYPAPSAGFFLKGGLGVGGWTASGNGSSATESGFGLVGGVGYDLPVGKTISITPTATYRWSKVGNDINQNVLQVGLSFTLH